VGVPQGGEKFCPTRAPGRNRNSTGMATRSTRTSPKIAQDAPVGPPTKVRHSDTQNGLHQIDGERIGSRSDKGSAQTFPLPDIHDRWKHTDSMRLNTPPRARTRKVQSFLITGNEKPHYSHSHQGAQR